MQKEDDLRYSRMNDILQIVIRMQGTREGLTLAEIVEDLGANTSRRTAERIKNAILISFPQIAELESNDRYKRWGFTNWNGQREFISGLISFTQEELLELEKLKKQAASKGDDQRKQALKAVVDKVTALMRDSRDNADYLQDNIKTLLELEGYAINQYPKENLNYDALKVIRTALKSNRKLSFDYTKRNSEKTTRTVEPYGVLYNFKNYLVANDGGIKLFDICNIEDIKLEKETFKPDKDFNLEEFASKSFGIYQEKPLIVKLLFDKEAGSDAKNYHFHPTQQFKENADGTVEVSFTAGGTKTICWELFKWGEHVKILAPQVLKGIYTDELHRVLEIAKN